MIMEVLGGGVVTTDRAVVRASLTGHKDSSHCSTTEC